MNIARMHSEIKLRFNDLNTNKQIDLPPAYIDDVLNDTINDYVEIFYSGNNFKKYKIGFELTQQRVDMLSGLLVGPFEQDPINYSKKQRGIYEFRLSDFLYPYKHLIRAEVETDCGNVAVSVMPHDHLSTALRNPNLAPSRVWKRAVGTFKKAPNQKNSALYVYTNEEFEITTLHPEYIKMPDKVFLGGYNTLEFLEGDTTALNSSSNPVDCDISEQYHGLIVDMTVQQLSRIFEEGNKYNLHGDKVFTIS